MSTCNFHANFGTKLYLLGYYLAYLHGYTREGCQQIYTQLNICVFKCQHFYNTLFAPIFCRSYWAIWDKKTPAQKHKNYYIWCPIYTCFMQIRSRFIVHFSWVQISIQGVTSLSLEQDLFGHRKTGVYDSSAPTQWTTPCQGF